MQLVPLDLEGDDCGHEVVDVRFGRDQHGQRVLAVVVPALSPGGCLYRLPAQDLGAKHGPESLRALTHDDAAAARDGRRQAPHGVEEGAHIGFRLSRQRMKHRAHAQVGLDQ